MWLALQSLPAPIEMRRALVALCASALLIWPRAASADAVTLWNENAGNAAIAAGITPDGNPLHESRMYAMVHAAIHDALNAIDRRSRPYIFDARAASNASTDAAVAAAARRVLVTVIAQLTPPFDSAIAAGIARVELDYAAALATIPPGPARDAGIEIGEAAAAAILTLRSNDGSNTELLGFDYPQGDEPGEYRFPPQAPLAFAPRWGDVTPFVLNSSAQFRANGPYDLRTQKYAADYNEVKDRGSATGSTRSAVETQTGLFWLESSPLAWNRIARTVSASRGLGLWENARLFGLLNLALADGYIASWDTKYHYNFWRPETAIHFGDSDGNPDTTGDPSWAPLQPTYPIPDHDSAHSVQGGAAAEVLKQFFGGDNIGFTACSRSLPPGSRCSDASPVLRTYASFSQAADENGLSRILVGIHFRRAVDEGIEHGRKIANRAANLFLRPVH
jgi:hypothetical protein